MLTCDRCGAEIRPSDPERSRVLPLRGLAREVWPEGFDACPDCSLALLEWLATPPDEDRDGPEPGDSPEPTPTVNGKPAKPARTPSHEPFVIWSTASGNPVMPWRN